MKTMLLIFSPLIVLLFPLIAVGQCNNDVTTPTAICPTTPVPIYLNNNGVTWITGAILDSASFDNCQIAGYQINGVDSVVYNCADIGVLQSQTLTVFDSAGNTASCISTITVLDTLAPVITCNDTLTVQLNQQGVAIVQAISLVDNSFDACTILDYQMNGMPSDTFDCSTVGTFPLAVLSVTDASGNQSSCVSTIEVLDNIRPVAICQNADIYLNNTGTSTFLADSIDGGSTDNCLILSKTFINGTTAKSFTCADLGVNTATLLVTDIYGNVDSCITTVTVLDTVAPNVICNGITVDLTQVGQVVLGVAGGPLSVAIAMDNCGIDTVFVTPDTITCADVGNVPFTVTAVDLSGNINSCQDTAKVLCLLDMSSIANVESQVVVSPNPIINEATIVVEGQDYSTMNLVLFNLIGQQQIVDYHYENNQLEFSRKGLDTGIYIYQLMADKKVIAVGKLIVE